MTSLYIAYGTKKRTKRKLYEKTSAILHIVKKYAIIMKKEFWILFQYQIIVILGGDDCGGTKQSGRR